MKITYNCCQLQNHEQQFLFDICIDGNCKSNQKLLCGFCKDDHSDHRNTTLKKFLLEFQQQFKKHSQEEEDYYSQYSLSKAFAQMEFETKRAKQIICSRFDSFLTSLKEAQSKLQTFKDPSYEEIGKVLATITTSETMQTDIGTLTKLIESFVPLDGNTFQLKKPVKKVGDLKERFKEAENIQKDYVEFNKQYLSEFENQIKLICDQIEKLSESDPKKISKQLLVQQVQMQSPQFKYLEEQKEKTQIVIPSPGQKEMEFIELPDIKETDVPLFSLLQNAIPKKQVESSQPLSQDYFIEPISCPNQDENNETCSKVKDIEVCLDKAQTTGQAIQKALFIDGENVFFVFYDGKGLHYNLKLTSLGHFDTELGSTINDVSYSAYTKHLCFGTKQGQLHIFEFNLDNQLERPLIRKNSLRLENSSILFVQACHQDHLVYTLSSSRNLKAINTIVQHSSLTKYHPPQPLDKPIAILRYFEKNQVWICGETGFFVYEVDNGRGKYHSLEDRNDRASGYFIKAPFLYVVCQKHILIKWASSSFQIYNKSQFEFNIKTSLFLPLLDLFIVNLQKSSGKNQTWILSMNKGCGGKREKIDDDEWNLIIPHNQIAVVAKTSGTFRCMNFSEKKRI